MAVKTKEIAIKFANVSEPDKARLQAFLSRELLVKNVVLDTQGGDKANLRSVFRVINRGGIGKIKIVTAPSPSIPQQELLVEITNISVGGCLVIFPDGVALSKGGTIYFNFDFLKPAVSVQGVILGRRGG